MQSRKTQSGHPRMPGVLLHHHPRPRKILHHLSPSASAETMEIRQVKEVDDGPREGAGLSRLFHPIIWLSQLLCRHEMIWTSDGDGRRLVCIHCLKKGPYVDDDPKPAA